MIRLFLFATLITLVGTAFRPALSPKFASIAGTWKRTGMSLVEANGKTTDMEAMLSKSMPCSKDIKYTFLGDGKVSPTRGGGFMKKYPQRGITS